MSFSSKLKNIYMCYPIKRNIESNNLNQITIGYLSWKRHDVLKQTLVSHKDLGLFDIIPPKNRIIFFQEFSNIDKEIADQFNLTIKSDAQNVGILNAFINLVENCNTEYFIFSENDWLLRESKEDTEKTLNDCLDILKNNKADMIRLRSKKHPGVPYFSSDSWINEEISENNPKDFPYKLESLSWVKAHNNNLYSDDTFQDYQGNYKWYITSIHNQRWSNNIFITKTSYLKEIILPLVTMMKRFDASENNYSGLEEVLMFLNNYHGQYSDLDKAINRYNQTKIASGPGLFTHKDKCDNK
jgi:hypothetical protein